MNKDAPTLGRILTMVGFALSCFGLLLFLWLAFGGSIPLAPQRLPVPRQVPRGRRSWPRRPTCGSPACRSARSRTSSPTQDGADRRHDRARREVRADPAQRPRDPAPEDAARRDLRRAHAGRAAASSGWRCPRTARCRRRNVAPDGAARRDLPRLQPEDPAGVPAVDAAPSEAFAGRSAGHQQRAGQPRPDGRGRQRPRAGPELAAAAPCATSCKQHGRGVQRAVGPRDGQLASLIRNSNVVFGVTARQNAALKADLRGAARRSSTRAGARCCALDHFARNTNPLVTQLRPAARQLSPTLEDLARLAPDLKALFRDLGPLITVSVKGLPAISTFLDQPRPVLAQLDPFLRNLNPAIDFLGLYKQELNAFFSNTVAATQAVTFPPNAKRPARPLPAHDQPGQPREPGHLPPPAGHQPAQPLPGAGRLQLPRRRRPLQVFENRQCTAAARPRPRRRAPIRSLPLLDTFFFQTGSPTRRRAGRAALQAAAVPRPADRLRGQELPASGRAAPVEVGFHGLASPARLVCPSGRDEDPCRPRGHARPRPAAAACSRSACVPSTGTDTLVSSGLGLGAGHRRLPQALRRRRDRRAHPRGPPEPRRHQRPRAPDQARGLPRAATSPRARSPTARRAARAGGWPRSSTRASSTGRGPSCSRRPTRSRASSAAGWPRRRSPSGKAAARRPSPRPGRRARPRSSRPPRARRRPRTRRRSSSPTSPASPSRPGSRACRGSTTRRSSTRSSSTPTAARTSPRPASPTCSRPRTRPSSRSGSSPASPTPTAATRSPRSARATEDWHRLPAPAQGDLHRHRRARRGRRPGRAASATRSRCCSSPPWS